MVAKQVTFQKAALRALIRMPANEATRIRAKIDQYAMDPGSLKGQIKKLQGRDGYRLRVGNWRVLFDEDGTVLDIIDIGPRGSIY